MIVDVAGQVELKKVTGSPVDGEGLLTQELEFVHPSLGKMLHGQEPLLGWDFVFCVKLPHFPQRARWGWLGGGKKHLHRRKHPVPTTLLQRLFLTRRPCRAPWEQPVGSQA